MTAESTLPASPRPARSRAGTPLSCYVLTRDSQKYLDRILAQAGRVADELVIVDSGSTDRTEAIAHSHRARFVVHPFENFATQRHFALTQCQHDWVLSFDSDEIPDDALVEALLDLKAADFHSEDGSRTFRLRRHWYALGKRVRAVYPIGSPDAPIRLVRKPDVHYLGAMRVHETPQGTTSRRILERGSIEHHTFETPEEIERKLEAYTSLAALDMRDKGKRGSRTAALLHGAVAFFKWYILRGSYRDGYAGWRMGRYAFEYVYLKYVKLMRLR